MSRRTSRGRSEPAREDRGEDDLREYHEAPPALVRDMERWLEVGDRRASAERVRAWLLESYALGAGLGPTPPPRSRRARPTPAKRRVSRGSSSR